MYQAIIIFILSLAATYKLYKNIMWKIRSIRKLFFHNSIHTNLFLKRICLCQYNKNDLYLYSVYNIIHRNEPVPHLELDNVFHNESSIYDTFQSHSHLFLGQLNTHFNFTCVLWNIRTKTQILKILENEKFVQRQVMFVTEQHNCSVIMTVLISQACHLQQFFSLHPSREVQNGVKIKK